MWGRNPRRRHWSGAIPPYQCSPTGFLYPRYSTWTQSFDAWWQPQRKQPWSYHNGPTQVGTLPPYAHVSSTKYFYEQMRGMQIPHHGPCWPATSCTAMMTDGKLRSRYAECARERGWGRKCRTDSVQQCPGSQRPPRSGQRARRTSREAEADIHLRVGGPIDIGSVTRNGVSHVRLAVGVAAVHRHRCGVNHAGTWVYTLTASVRSRKANCPRRQALPPLPAPQDESPALPVVFNRAARQELPAPQGEPPAPPAFVNLAARRTARVAGRSGPCPRFRP